MGLNCTFFTKKTRFPANSFTKTFQLSFGRGETNFSLMSSQQKISILNDFHSFFLFSSPPFQRKEFFRRGARCHISRTIQAIRKAFRKEFTDRITSETFPVFLRPRSSGRREKICFSGEEKTAGSGTASTQNFAVMTARVAYLAAPRGEHV